MRRWVSLALAVVAPAAIAWGMLAACSSFDGTSPSPPPETGQPGPDVAIDAPADAPSVLVPFCKTVDAHFCADFEVPPLEDRWTRKNVDHGRLELSEGGADGSAHALRAIVSDCFNELVDGQAPDGGLNRLALLEKEIVREGASGFRIDVDVRVEGQPDGSVPTVLSLVSLITTQYGLAVTLRGDGGIVFVHDNADAAGNFAKPFPLPVSAGWFRLGIEMNFIEGTVVIYVDGTPKTLALPAFTTSDSLVGVSAGVYVDEQSNGAGEARVMLDNFTLRRF